MSELEDILCIKFPDNCNISYITNNSKKVKKDSVFFALQGTINHGSIYAEEALKLGASIVVHDDVTLRTKNKKIFYIKDLENKILKFLNSYYKFDINNNNFFAFTGTNGKTSSAFLCHQLLNKMGFESIYIGTIGTKHNEKDIKTSFSSKTTPDIFELFEIVDSVKCDMNLLNICIEISSHALDQKRLEGINHFNSASILNIKNDHLDYHQNMSSYVDSKFNIFKTSSTVKLIKDELLRHTESYESSIKKNQKIITISDMNDCADIYFKIEEASIKESEFYILLNNPPQSQEHEKGKKYRFKCNLFPAFNISNLVFTICSIGFEEFSENLINDLSFLKLPKGRAELIENISHNIIVDYAHNEDAIKNFLNSIEEYFENLIVVFGCGGDRDKDKRSKMLKSAIENSSKVIFTSDNLRDETFEKIFEDAKEGNNLDSVIKIRDRKEAIMHGTQIITNKDCLVVLGKGHEQFQEIKGSFVEYSDHEVINEIYR